jgi:hypothetical protein
MNANLKSGKGGQETELNGKRSLRGRKFALDCSFLCDEEYEDEEEEK